jgi:hypothetical protein
MNLVRFFAITVMLFSQHVALALDNPMYQNGLLTIPHVDTPEQVGKYLDVTLKHKEGAWVVDSYKESGSVESKFLPVDKVEANVVDGFPIQVILRISSKNIACGSLGQINYRLDNKAFNITVHDGHAYLPPGEVACVAALQPFSTSIALPVYGLKAGTYTYMVNGKISGEFALDVDNYIR